MIASDAWLAAFFLALVLTVSAWFLIPMGLLALLVLVADLVAERR